MPKGGVNTKKEAGRAKKAETEAKKQTEIDKRVQAEQALEWSKGANVRKQQKDEEAARKADEIARKSREKEELLAEEAATLGSGGKQKTGPKKNKPKNDLAFLEDALVKAADKNVKKKKEELLQKQREEEKKEKEKANVAPLDPLFQNTEDMLCNGEMVGRQSNKIRMDIEAGASGLDAALDHLDISSSNNPIAATSAKALYNKFEAKMLPQVKEDYPGLRLTQYKEKVWALWKKSSDNPANQVPIS